MNRMKQRTVWALLAVLLLLLSACGGTGTEPTNEAAPEMTQAQFNQAVGSLGMNMLGVATSLQNEPGVQAVAAFPSGGLFGGDSSPPLPTPPGLLGQLETLADIDLVRGVYVYDGAAQEWVLIGDSQNLVLQWDFFGSNGATSTAEATVNWGNTQEVDSPDGSVEVPAEMTVTLQVDGAAAGKLDVNLAWYDAAACGGAILEPASINLDGYIGSSSRITFNDLTLGLLDQDGGADILMTSGSVSATAGENSAELSWNASVGGEVQRGDDCYAEDFEVNEATASIDVNATNAGDSRSLGFGVKVDSITTEPVSANLSGGIVEVDGATAVTFSGTLDDTNGNEVPGENVTLNFADGESMTLEMFLSSFSVMGALF